jgi:hypothetical protein
MSVISILNLTISLAGFLVALRETNQFKRRRRHLLLRNPYARKSREIGGLAVGMGGCVRWYGMGEERGVRHGSSLGDTAKALQQVIAAQYASANEFVNS